jgi:hypothetical protein
MKTFIISVLFFAATSFAGFYMDIVSLGIGGASTSFDGENFDDSCVGCDQMALDLSGSIGGGWDRLYIVGTFAMFANRFDDSGNYIQFNHYILGPGIVFYPVRFFQVGASIGFSWVADQSDIVDFYDSRMGFGTSINAAFDVGNNYVAGLFGVRFNYSSVPIGSTTQATSYFGPYAGFTVRIR